MPGFWSLGPDINSQRTGSSSFGTASACVVAAGYFADATNRFIQTAEEYDGTSWSSINDLPNSSHYGCGFGSATGGAVTGGQQSTTFGDLTNKTQEYDGSVWSLGGNLPEDIRFHGSAPKGTLSAGLVFGGRHLESTSGDHMLKDATREYNGTSWSTGGTLPSINNLMGGIGVQNDALCCGGKKYDAPAGPWDSVHNYDGSSWSSHSTLPSISSFFNGAGTTSDGLLVGNSDANSSTFEYDGSSWLTSGTCCWYSRSSGCQPVGSSSAAVVAGGSDGDYPPNPNYSYIQPCEEWNASTVPSKVVGYSNIFEGADYIAKFYTPDNIVVDDIMIAFLLDTDEDTFSTPTGWNLGGSTVADRNAVFYWFWRRADSTDAGGDSHIFASASDSGALICGAGIVVRGALTSATPFENTQSWGTTQGTSATINGLTTQGDGRLILALIGIEDAETASTPTNYLRIYDRYTEVGGDGRLLFFVREFASQGSVPPASCTISNNEYLGTFTIAVIPEPVIEDFVEAEAGSYSLTGSTDTSFKAKLVVGSGVYEYIPTIPATLPCAIGSYALWGKEVSEEINANPAVYSLAGTPAGLDRRRIPIKGVSMIVDVATNWGDTSNASIWSIELFYKGEKLVFDNTNLDGDCPENYMQGEVENAFDMKTTYNSHTIISHAFYTTNSLTGQFRFYMNFLDGEIEFDEMIILNAFGAGFSYFDNRGVKDIKIYMSDDYQDSYVYEETIPNSRLIFDGQIPKNPSDTVPYPYSVPLIGSFMPGNPGEYSINGTSTALERNIGIDDWEDTWLSDWAYRATLEADYSKFSDNVEGLPFKIVLCSEGGGQPSPFENLTHIFDEIGSSYLKIAITDYTGLRQLKVEVAAWDASEKFGLIYASESDQTFYDWKNTLVYLYFDSTKPDNTTYVGFTKTNAAKSVWDVNFKGVWHLVQVPTGGVDSIFDSTSNEIHGTPIGLTADDFIDMDGHNKGYVFNNIDTAIKLSCDKSYFNFTKNSGLFTLEAFAQLATDSPSLDTIIGSGAGNYDHGFALRLTDESLYSQHVLEFGAFKGVPDPPNYYNTNVVIMHSGQGTVNDLDCHYLAVKSTDWTNRGIRFFVDAENKGYSYERNEADLEGVLDTQDALYDTYIGAVGKGSDPYYSNMFDGNIAEVRASDIPRTDAWMRATNYDLWDNLLIYGITEELVYKGRPSYGGEYNLIGHETEEKTKELGSGSFSLNGTDVAFFAQIDLPTLPLTAKSVILDIESNYGNEETVGLRHLEFYLEGNLVDVYFIAWDSTEDDIEAYGFRDSNTFAEYVFGTGEAPGINSLRLDGSYSNVSWRAPSYYNITGGIRITGVFDTPITFDEIIYYNYHNYGTDTDVGIKTVKINISSSAITIDTADQHWSVDYDISIPNSLLIFWGDLERHSEVDEADGHNLALPGTLLAKSGSLSIVGSEILMGINRTMPAGSGEYSLSGSTVDLIVSTTGIGIYTYVGYDTAKRLFIQIPGEYVLSGQPIEHSRQIVGDSGVYNLIGSPTNHADSGTYRFIESNTVLGISFPGLGGVYNMEFSELYRLYCMPGELTLEGPDQLSSINLKRKSEGHPVFFFKLTGEENETTDLEIPIGLIQATLRSGRATYLRVWVPDITLASEITARKDGTMQVDMAYRLPNGAVTQRELIIEANLGDIRIKREAEEGAENSIYLVGHKQKTFTKKSITLYDPSFKQRKNGQLKQCSFPEPNLYINPGDQLIVDGETLDIDLIRLTIQNENSKMEVYAA